MAMVNIPVEPPVTEYLYQKASYYGIPLSGTFELTPVCNMACRMCYVRMTKQQQENIAPLRSASQWLALAEEVKEKGTLYLLLTGGEPFLRPDFREIFTGIHKMGFITSINSNGTLIDEDTVSWLKETPPMRINMTLYGASDATYERLCGHPQGFTRIMKAIDLLRDAGISVKLNCSLTPYNIEDLDEIMAFAQREQLVVQATSYMFPPLRRDSSQIGRNDRFTPEEAAYYAAKIESLMNGEENFLKMMEEREFPPLPSDLDDCEESGGEGIRCRAGKCSYWVTWNGTFLPCGMMPTANAKNVFTDGFDSSWEAAHTFAYQIRLPAKCASCGSKDQCRACAAMVYTESGCFDKVPEYRCLMSQHYPEACRRLAEEIRQKSR